MTNRRKIEIFSAGCPVCEETVARIRDLACPACKIIVLDINDAEVLQRARLLGVRTMPAITLDGKLADCCAGGGPDEATLRAAGLGQAL